MARAARPRRRHLEERGHRRARSCGRIGASAALLELEARQVARALRGDLNRVLNAESANLQRSVGARGPAARGDRRSSRPTAGSREQPPSSARVADARRETPEATLSELAERLELHRSAVQRALDRIERLALHDDEGIGRAPARERRGGAPASDAAFASRRPVRERAVASGMIRAMRPIVIAANWKMNTTPADAGELAAHDRGADARARRHPGHLPAVRVPRAPSATRSRGEDVAVGAQNVHHELAGAFTGEIVRADARRASRRG